MSQQKTPLRPTGLVEWAFLLVGIWSAFSFFTQLLAGSRGRISWLDLLIAGAALYWFGIHRGWFQQLKTPSMNPSIEIEDEDFTFNTANANLHSGAAQTPASEPQRFEIILPRSIQWQPTVAASFTKAFYDRLGTKSIFLSIRATHDSLKWVILQAPDLAIFTAKSLETFVNQFYPGAQVKEIEAPPTEFPFYRRYKVFAHQASEYYDLFAPVTAQARFDPLHLVAQTMTRLEPGEYLGYFVIVAEPRLETNEEIETFLSISAHDAGYRTTVHVGHSSSWGEFLVGLGAAKTREWWGDKKLKEKMVMRFDDRKTEIYLSKLQQKIATVAVFMFFDTPNKERLDFITSVAGAVKDLSPDGEAKLKDGVVEDAVIKNDQDDEYHSPGAFFIRWTETSPDYRSLRHFFPMTAEEVACLWHLPHSGFEGLKINWKETAKAPLPSAMQNVSEDALMLGYARTDEGKLPARMLEKDRAMHMIITGQIGMGKSTLIHNLIHQDIQAGRGVALIDPKGDLFVDVLQRSCKSSKRFGHRRAENKGDISDVFTLNSGQLANSVHGVVEGSAA